MLRLFRRRKSLDDEPARDQILRLERELQEARLEFAEGDRSRERLRGELAKARERADELAGQHARADVERLVMAIGAPVVQIVTMDHLHRSGAAEMKAADVLEVGMRLVRSLGQEGVQTVGVVGETATFDPDLHDPLSMSGAPKAGGQVVIRVAGLSYVGKVVRKAGVDVVGADDGASGNRLRNE